MRAAVFFAVLLLLPPAALGAAEGEKETTISLEDLGLGADLSTGGPFVDLPFRSRVDRLLVGGELELELDRGAAHASMRGLVVSINGEEIGRVEREDLFGKHRFPFEGRLLGEANLLRLERITDRAGACGFLGERRWAGIVGGALRLRGVSLPVAAELSMLPLPWLDRGFDQVAEVHLSLPSRPSPELLHAASLVAGWLGKEGGLPIRFSIHLGGGPPDHHAILLIDGEESAASQGSDPPTGPAVRIVGGEAGTSSHARYLVVEGRSGRELVRAAMGLARRDGLEGRVARFEGEPGWAGPPARRNHAPRWVAPGKDPTFEELAGGDLITLGDGSESLELGFRIAPDLFVWPEEWVELALEYTVSTPSGVPAPRLGISFNDQFLRTLPATSSHSETVRIHRDLLRGYNEIRLHVHQGPGACEGGGGAEVAFRKESTLKLGGANHSIRAPDLQAFAYDGFPFTEGSDLSSTTLVLPRNPRREEVASALSLLAWFSSITGDVGYGLRTVVLDALDSVEPLGDLLVVAGADRLPDQGRLPPALPASATAEGILLRDRSFGPWLLELLEGRPWDGERSRAEEALRIARAPAVLMGARSPYDPHGSLVLVTAPAPESLPDASDLLGHADSRRRGGDLFVVAGGGRSFFQIGPTYERGSLPLVTRIRWELSLRWGLLLPLSLAGSFSLAILAARSLARRERERLAAGRRA